jgi:integrase
VLGDRIVADLKPSDVNRLLAHYNGQARKTRRNLLLFVKSLLGTATSEGYASEDVSRSPLVQRPRAVKEQDTGEIQIMSPEAIGRLLDASEERARPLFHLLASTGLRLGEALSLMWGDVDTVAGTLQVKRTLFKNRFYSPKSRAAIRTVDLGAQAAGMLAALRRERFREEAPPADALLFPGQGGRAQDPAALPTRGMGSGAPQGGAPAQSPALAAPHLCFAPPGTR